MNEQRTNYTKRSSKKKQGFKPKWKKFHTKKAKEFMSKFRTGDSISYGIKDPETMRRWLEDKGVIIESVKKDQKGNVVINLISPKKKWGSK